MDETVVGRCPAIHDPRHGLTSPGGFDGIVDRLASAEPISRPQDRAGVPRHRAPRITAAPHGDIDAIVSVHR